MKYNILFIMLYSTTFYHLASSYEELWEKFCMGSTTDGVSNSTWFEI